MGDRRFLAIFLIVLIDVLGLMIIMPLLPFYAEHFGATPFQVGLLVSAFAVCQFFSGPILGRWSDRWGRKPILVISQIGTLGGFLMLAWAPSLAWIFVSRIIDGLTAGNITTAQAYIVDVSVPEHRAKSLGRIGAAFGIGLVFGPLMSSFFLRFGPSAPMYAASAFSFCSILATTFFLPSKESHQKPPEPAPKEKWWFVKNRNLMMLLSAMLLFYIAFAMYMSGFPLFAERRFIWDGQFLTDRHIGFAFAYFGLVAIVVQGFLIGKITKAFQAPTLVRAGFVSFLIGATILAFISQTEIILLTGLLIGFGAGVLRPTLLSGLVALVDPSDRGLVIGVNQSLSSIAQITAPIIGNAIIGAGDLGAWPMTMGACALLGLGLYLKKATN